MCVRACVRLCVRVCVCVCVRERVCVHVCVHERVRGIAREREACSRVGSFRRKDRRSATNMHWCLSVSVFVSVVCICAHILCNRST